MYIMPKMIALIVRLCFDDETSMKNGFEKVSHLTLSVGRTE